MSVLREILRHPANQGRAVATTLRWARHNLRRRLTPTELMTVRVGASQLTGPVDHPSVNYAVYIPTGRHDAGPWAIFDLITEPGDAFVDVGASIGLYSVLMDALVGAAGSIVAVELDAEQVPLLSHNLERLAATTYLVERALADSVRTLGFAQHGPTIGHLVDDPTGDITTATLDEVVEPIGLPEGRRTIVKIDVEGWEPAVLLGAERTLERTKALLVEARGYQDRSPVAWEEGVAMARNLGFVFVWPHLTDLTLQVFDQPGPVAPHGDYVLVRQEQLDRLIQAGFTVTSPA